MNTIEKTLQELETSFSKFQEKHEKRWNQMCAQFEPVTKQESCLEFHDFVRTGRMMQKSLTASDAPGSYFVPHPVVHMMDRHMQTLNPLRHLCRVTSITTDRLELLSEEGDTEIGWVHETEERPETNVTGLRQKVIPTHTMYARPRLTQQILDDSAIDLSQWIGKILSEYMAITEKHAFLYGNGKKQPQGLLTVPTTSLGKGTFDTAEKMEGPLSADLLFQTLASLEGRFLNQAVWIMGRRSVAKIQALRENGTMLWQASLSQKMPATLLGHPVWIVDEMEDQVVFGNLHAAYHIVDRQGMTLLRDPYSAKPYIEFYATKRVGGAIVDARAMKIISV